jgi:hypothetical protein
MIPKIYYGYPIILEGYSDANWISDVDELYLASATRPDISFAISKLSQFTSNPGDGHWCALE